MFEKRVHSYSLFIDAYCTYIYVHCKIWSYAILSWCSRDDKVYLYFDFVHFSPFLRKQKYPFQSHYLCFVYYMYNSKIFEFGPISYHVIKEAWTGFCLDSVIVLVYQREAAQRKRPDSEGTSNSPTFSFQIFPPQVNENGFLSFADIADAPYPVSIYSVGIIAPLWTNLNVTSGGQVFYQKFTNGSLLSQATEDINRMFPDEYFTPSWLFIVTWEKVSLASDTGVRFFF